MNPAATHRYAPYYCEENIYALCGEALFRDGEALVAMISNQARACPLWSQRAAPRAGLPVVWDYHVILLARDELRGWNVWDLDTVAGCPLPIEGYLGATFGPFLDGAPSPELPPLSPRFRLIEAGRYRAEFSSDRRHMRGPDGQWLQPPPPWPTIERPGAASFLAWTEVSDGQADWIDLEELLARLGGARSPTR